MPDPGLPLSEVSRTGDQSELAVDPAPSLVIRTDSTQVYRSPSVSGACDGGRRFCRALTLEE